MRDVQHISVLFVSWNQPYQAISWRAGAGNGVTPLQIEKEEWKCWGTRSTIADARARLSRWDTRPVADMLILRITITPNGLLNMICAGKLEILQDSEKKMRIYMPLHRNYTSLSGDMLYKVEEVYAPRDIVRPE